MMRWLLLLFVLGFTGLAPPLAAQHTARVQFVHNVADPDVGVVDVYINGRRIVDDLAFRSATPFLEVPGGDELNMVVAPGSSDDAGNPFAAFPVSFQPDRDYVAVASGVLYPGRFASNASGMSTELRLIVQEDVRTSSRMRGRMQLFVAHGVTDLPAVDLRRSSGDVLFDDIAYGDVTGYLGLDPLMYVLRIVAEDDDQIVARVLARLGSLGGQAGALVLSGFADPAANQDGPGLALLLVAPTGEVAELPLWRPRR